MERRPWLEQLNLELAGQGLPVGVRKRLLSELQDHLDDLTEGGTQMITGTELNVRLGAPADLARHTADEHRRASWVRRHPRLVFLLAPIPTALLFVVLYVFVAAVAAYAITKAGLAEPDSRGVWEKPATVFVSSIRFVPFLIAAAFFSHLALRTQVRRWCVVAAITQIALLAGFATTSLAWSDTPGQSQFLVGLNFPFGGWLQAMQLLLPLALGGFALWIATRSQRAEIAA